MPPKRTRSQIILSYWGKLLLVRKREKFKDRTYFTILKRSPSVPGTDDDFRNLREVYHYCDLPGKLKKKKMEEEMKRISEIASTSRGYRAIPQSKPKKIKFSFKSFLNIFPKFKKQLGKLDKSKSIHPNKIHAVKGEASPEHPGTQTEGSPGHPGPRTDVSSDDSSFWSDSSLDNLGRWTEGSPKNLDHWIEGSPDYSDSWFEPIQKHPGPRG